MASILEELVIVLGVDLASDVLNKVKPLVTILEETTKEALTAGGKLTALAGAYTFLANRVNDAASDLYKFKQLTTIATDTIQELQHAVESVGGDSQSLKADLMSLTHTMSSPIPGEFNEALFWLGINVRDANGELKKSSEVLLDIADKFQQFDDIEQLQWGEKIGLSQDTILMLKLGRDQIKLLMEEAERINALIPEEQLRNANLFIAELSQLRRIASVVAQEFFSMLGPGLKEVNYYIIEWLEKNKQMEHSKISEVLIKIRGGWEKVKEILAKVKSFLDIPWLNKFTDQLNLSNASVAILFGLLGGLSSMVLKFGGGLLWSAVKLGFFGLLIEDVIIWLQGGDSAIGRFITWVRKLYDEFSEAFPGISGFVGAFWQKLEDFYGWLSSIDFGEWISSFDLSQLSSELNRIVLEFEEKFPGISGIIKTSAEIIDDIFKSMKEALEEGALEKIIQGFTTLSSVVGAVAESLAIIVDKFLQLSGFDGNEIDAVTGRQPVEKPMQQRLKEALEPAADKYANFMADVVIPLFWPFKNEKYVPAPASTGGSTNNTSNKVINHNTFNIRTDQPKKTAEEVDTAIRRMALNALGLEPGK